jgi:multiple sugar transport system substrate-binding protein
MSKFQMALLGIFGFFILLAVVVFAFYRGGSGSSTNATVTVWGELPAEELNIFLNATQASRGDLVIRYVEKSTETIGSEFTEALASGGGPDLIITTQDKLWGQKSKLLPIPYQSIGQNDFQSIFVEEGELFLANEGIYGLPLTLDPMVLYYNRDHLSAAGQAQPIGYWDELYAAASKLNRRDAAGNLTQSAIALGEARNIPHYKEILSMLMLQAGTPITAVGNGGELASFLSVRFDLPVSPGESALDFYTQFSNPSRAYYSWNRTMPSAETRFTSGDAAYYLGFASELTTLRNKNPNLNFSLTTVPQSRVAGRAVTFGRLYAVSISRGSKNTSAALQAALSLVSRDSALKLSETLRLPPARRDLLAITPSDAVMPVFYTAALQARGWLDPEGTATSVIFRDMIESVTSGRARTSEALSSANSSLEALIK